MKLSEFSNCSEQEYGRLQRDIDALPAGRVLLFDNCKLPPGSLPAQVTIGFYKENSRYSVYFDKVIRYSGRNRAMSILSNGAHQFFQNFSAMKKFLKSLPAESDAEDYDLNNIVSMEEISFPQSTTPTVSNYKTIQRELEKHIIGQEKAVETIAHQVTLHLNKSAPRKPLSIIAYGPPGTGKSEAAKALPKILSRLCSNNYATVWTELNTFSEAHSVYRLTGSPPGYIGYDDAPVFEAVTHNPYTIFLFDELDKAHPEVLKTFMSILDEGRCAARKELPDHSREYDFRHCIFIFTSNFRLGATPKNKVGFTLSDDIEDICHTENSVEISYRDRDSDNEFSTTTKRIYHDTEAARKAFVEVGVLKEIASRFGCFVEFQELSNEAKIRILAKQVVETGFEYNIRLTHIASAILQSLIDASMSENVLTVRSFKSVIEGYLASAFAEAGIYSPGQAVRLEGNIADLVVVEG